MGRKSQRFVGNCGSETHRAACGHVFHTQLQGQLVQVLEDLPGSAARRHEVSSPTSGVGVGLGCCPHPQCFLQPKAIGEGAYSLQMLKRREPEWWDSGKYRRGGSSTFGSSRSCRFIIFRVPALEATKTARGTSLVRSDAGRSERETVSPALDVAELAVTQAAGGEDVVPQVLPQVLETP